MVSIVWVQFLRFVRFFFFQKVGKDSFLSCIQSSFVSFLKLQKILNYTPTAESVFRWAQEKTVGELFAGGRRTRRWRRWMVVNLSDRQFRRIQKSRRIIICRRRRQVPGSDWFLTQVIGSPFKFLVRHPRPRPNRRRQDSSRTTRHTKSNKIASLFQFLISC